MKYRHASIAVAVAVIAAIVLFTGTDLADAMSTTTVTTTTVTTITTHDESGIQNLLCSPYIGSHPTNLTYNTPHQVEWDGYTYDRYSVNAYIYCSGIVPEYVSEVNTVKTHVYLPLYHPHTNMQAIRNGSAVLDPLDSFRVGMIADFDGYLAKGDYTIEQVDRETNTVVARAIVPVQYD